MTDDRADLMLDSLKRVQGDVGSPRRDMTSMSVRISALEDCTKRLTTAVFGMRADVSTINHRLDRIERRLELTEEPL